MFNIFYRSAWRRDSSNNMTHLGERFCLISESGIVCVRLMLFLPLPPTKSSLNCISVWNVSFRDVKYIYCAVNVSWDNIFINLSLDFLIKCILIKNACSDKVTEPKTIHLNYLIYRKKFIHLLTQFRINLTFNL